MHFSVVYLREDGDDQPLILEIKKLNPKRKCTLMIVNVQHL